LGEWRAHVEFKESAWRCSVDSWKLKDQVQRRQIQPGDAHLEVVSIYVLFKATKVEISKGEYDEEAKD
jgi:hypothetical protein